MSLGIQGIATFFNKPIWHGNHFIIFTPEAFNSSLKSDPHPRLLQDHKSETSFSNDRYPLQLHASKEFLTFRYTMPEAADKSFADYANDFETYLGVSIGFVTIKETVSEIDGFAVKTIYEAILTEVSLLSTFPAVDGTYARIVDVDNKDSLDLEAETGIMASVGKFISLHRKSREFEVGGKTLKYGHTTSAYERKASDFTDALARLC